MIDFQIRIAVLAAFVSGSAGGVVEAQVGSTADALLGNAQNKVGVLEAVDTLEAITIDSYSLTGSRMISVQSQAEIDVAIYDPANVLLTSGTLKQLQSTVDPFGLLMPTSVGGYEWTTIIDNPQAGAYRVEVTHGSTAEDSLIIVTSEALDDDLGAALVAVVDERLGPVAGIALFVAEAGVSCSGGVASASVHAPDDTVSTVALKDDGMGADHTANDGVYSAGYDIEADGEHVVVAQFNGIVPSGTPGVQLEATTSFIGSTATPILPDPPILIHPLPWAVDFILDDADGDGLYEHAYIDLSSDMLNDSRGQLYTTELTLEILESDVSSVYSPLVLSSSDTFAVGSNTVRVEIPMATASVLGDSVRLNLDTAEFTASGHSIAFSDLDVTSDYIDFDQFEHCPADVNLDWQVTPSDFTAWIAAYNNGDLLADVNGDGEVTPSDFTAWMGHFNAGC